MIESRHAGPTVAAITPVPFRNSGGLSLEVIPLRTLRQRGSMAHFSRPQQMEFPLLMLCDNDGSHIVDFIRYPTRSGTVVTVRPGQVQQFDIVDWMAGWIVAIDPVFWSADWPDAAIPTCVQLDQPAWSEAREIVQRIEADTARAAPNALAIGLLRQRVGVLLHLLALAAPAPLPEPGGAAALVGAFRRLVEAEFRAHNTLAVYADQLGITERTLARACRVVTGQSAQALVRARLLLEAKRLLAHSDLTVAEVGEALGFAEPTNFGRFFRSGSGSAPGAFRATQRNAAGAAAATQAEMAVSPSSRKPPPYAR